MQTSRPGKLRLSTRLKPWLFLFLLASCYTSKAQWTNTQTNGTNYMCMVSADTGYVCSWGGMIKKTTDGCNHFVYLNTGVTETLYTIDFPSSTVGYAGGKNGTIIKTSNSGCSWTTLSVPTSAIINTISFANDLTGWTVSDNGEILKTIDGGTTWVIQKSVPGINILSVDCANALIATAVGANGSIFTTTDGGATWQSQSPGVTESFLTVKMVSTTLIFIGGESGIFRSADAGVSWTRVLYVPPTGYYWGLDFTDPLHGVTAADLGGIFKTSDGGNTWSRMNSNKIFAPSTNYAPQLHNVNLVGNTGYISGESGLLFKMRTGDIYDWDYISTGVGFYHQKMVLASDNVAYAGGLGYFNKTTDAGKTWNEASHDPNDQIWALQFIDNNNALAVGNFGRILKTKDAGTGWHSQFSGTNKHLNALTYRTSGNAWAAGEDGTILHSPDGGISWQAQNSGVIQTLYGTSFISDNTGWACGWRNILKTTNGGATWNTIRNTTDETCTAIEFIDANTGWVCGVSSTTNGFVYKTTDGGATWLPQLQNLPVFVNPAAIAVTDPNNIWICCGQGKIMHSSDGGANWIEQTSNTVNSLAAIKFKDALNGYVAGTNGEILYTTDGGNNWSAQQYLGKNNFNSLSLTANGIYWAGSAGYIFFCNSNLSNQDNWLSQVYTMSGTDEEGAFDFSDALNGWNTGGGWDLYRTFNGGQSWKVISNIAASGSDTLFRDIDFKTQLLGYAAVQNDKFAKTTDGGKTWTYHDATARLLAVNFFDGNTGMFVGENGILVRTTDGCASATTSNHPSGQIFFKVQCTTATDVWVCSDSQLWFSGDGGATWQDKTPPGATGLSDFTFANDNAGWVLTNSFTAYSTSDKGSNWSTATIPGSTGYYRVLVNQQLQGMALSANSMAVFSTPLSGLINKNFKVDTLDLCKHSLRFTGLDTDPNSQFRWLINNQPYAGQVVSIIFPMTTDSINVKMVVTLGGSACSTVATTDSSVKIILFDSIPVSKFTAVSSCEGRNVAFSNQSTIIDAFTTYTWLFGDGSTGSSPNPVHAFPTATGYTTKLIAYSKNGCASDTFALPVVVKEPAIADAGPDFLIPPNTSFTLHGCCGDNYDWQPQSLLTAANTSTPGGQITADTYFTLITTSRDNCTASDQVLAKIFIGSEIYVPAAFTPNGDTKNDLLHALPVGVTLNKFVVYNRYGEKVFATTDASIGWDGSFKGKKQNTGTFTWYAEGITVKGLPIERKGTVLLIR